MAHAPFIDGHQSDLEAAVATADEAGDAADGVATQTSPPSKAGLETSVALLDLRNQLPSSLTGFLTITTSTTTTTTATGSSSRNSCSTTPGSCSSSAVNSILRPITDDLSYYPTTSSPTDDPIPHPHTDYTRHFMTPNQDDELMDKIIARRSTVKRPNENSGRRTGLLMVQFAIDAYHQAILSSKRASLNVFLGKGRMTRPTSGRVWIGAVGVFTMV